VPRRFDLRDRRKRLVVDELGGLGKSSRSVELQGKVLEVFETHGAKGAQGRPAAYYGGSAGETPRSYPDGAVE
jgi:hypothetical protein